MTIGRRKIATPRSTTTVTIIDAHLAALRLASYRPRTIDSRATVLRLWQTWLADQHATLLTATRLHAAAWVGREHLSPATRRAYRSHLRSFHRWTVEEGHATSDPTDRLPSIRVPAPVPRPVSQAQVAAALDGAPARMRAWLMLMAYAGLRCCEVAGLRPQDVEVRPDGNVLLYLRETKGGRPAWQPCHPAVVAALAALPVDSDGRWWTSSAHRIGIDVRAYLHGRGIPASSHRLRHYAGTAWIAASGHDLLTTAQLLRHVNVRTTQGYAQLDPVRPSQVVAAVAVAV